MQEELKEIVRYLKGRQTMYWVPENLLQDRIRDVPVEKPVEPRLNTPSKSLKKEGKNERTRIPSQPAGVDHGRTADERGRALSRRTRQKIVH